MSKKTVKLTANRNSDSGSKYTKSRNCVALKVSHLPKYFEEDQLRNYFSQFGNVRGVYLPRSKKTLKPKDRAFVLVDKEIAPIVASTVHNVLNFNRIMKCEVLEGYYPSWFNRTAQSVTTTERDKRRRIKGTLKSSERTSRRRMKILCNKVKTLRKANPALQLNLPAQEESSSHNL